MNLPKTYTDRNETGCCAFPNINDWDEKEVNFDNRRFIRMYTRSFLFVPLNMSRIMKNIQRTAVDAKAEVPADEVMILTRDISPWKAEQLYAVSKYVEGADNETLSGTYLTKVFEGPYKNAKNWYESMRTFVKSKDKNLDKIYFFYTTCPKCAKHYGKNYVIGLASVA